MELFDSWIADSIAIFVPPLFSSEVTSAIRQQVYRGNMTIPEATAVLNVALLWPVIVWEPGPSMQLHALNLSTRFNHPRAYDAQYLALSQILGCDFWTGDRRLVNSLQGALPWVRFVGDYDAS